MAIEKIPLTEFGDHFCVIEGLEHVYRNSDFRTHQVFSIMSSGGRCKIHNFIQCRTPEVRRKLQLQYPDDIRGCAVSLLEQALPDLGFGLGDIHRDAPSLVLDKPLERGPRHDQVRFRSASVESWVKNNCSGDVLAVTSPRWIRLSFELEDDFILTRLKFC